MDDFFNTYRTNPPNEKKVEIISGDGHDVKGSVFVVRSNPSAAPLPFPPGSYEGYQSTLSPSRKTKDGEVKRRKRIATYKRYGVEGKVKASFKDGYKWFKRRFSQILHRG